MPSTLLPLDEKGNALEFAALGTNYSPDRGSCRRTPIPRTHRNPTMSNDLLSQVRTIAAEVAAKHADDVDQKARFPSETIRALQQVRALSASVPSELGGAGARIDDHGSGAGC